MMRGKKNTIEKNTRENIIFVAIQSKIWQKPMRNINV